MSDALDTWTVLTEAMADCLTCGEQGPRGTDRADEDRSRRWARQHALRNPGHLVITEAMRGRCYRTHAPTRTPAPKGNTR